jgi:hypothetical protein
MNGHERDLALVWSQDAVEKSTRTRFELEPRQAAGSSRAIPDGR